MKFKALSVVNPAGSRIASGRKTIEVRKWKPDTLPLLDLVIVQNGVRLSSAELPEDPDGTALAIVDVVACTDWTEDLLVDSCAPYWERGWQAWHLTNIRAFDSSIPAPAKLRIYEVELPGTPLTYNGERAGGGQAATRAEST